MSAPPAAASATAASTSKDPEPVLGTTEPEPAKKEAVPVVSSETKAENQLQADPNEEQVSDGDSAFVDGASSSTSVADSIRDYRKLYGRTYHSYGNTEYWGPNDDKQNEQLDIGHHMFNLLFDGQLFLAPINPAPQKVVDIGTGTGIWAIDFADAYPSAKVIGTDLSPIQPTWVPPNVSFQIDDAQLPWTFTENDLDFVHIRVLTGSIADWPKLYENAFRCTKPGGYLEHVEYDITMTSDDGTVHPGHIMYDWPQTFINAGDKMGRTFKIAQNSKKLMEDAGFVDVVEKVWKLPSSGWPKDEKMKECGKWQLLYLTTGLEGMALYILSTVLEWEYTEIQAYVGKMKNALVNTKYHGYNKVHCVYGRKPGLDEVPKVA